MYDGILIIDDTVVNIAIIFRKINLKNVLISNLVLLLSKLLTFHLNIDYFQKQEIANINRLNWTIVHFLFVLPSSLLVEGYCFNTIASYAWYNWNWL